MPRFFNEAHPTRSASIYEPQVCTGCQGQAFHICLEETGIDTLSETGTIKDMPLSKTGAVRDCRNRRRLHMLSETGKCTERIFPNNSCSDELSCLLVNLLSHGVRQWHYQRLVRSKNTTCKGQAKMGSEGRHPHDDHADDDDKGYCFIM